MFPLIKICTLFLTLAILSNAGLTLPKSLQLKNELEMFENFMVQYQKQYGTNAEFETRFANFRTTLKRVARENGNPEDDAVYGVTKFSDLTREEFRARIGNIKKESGNVDDLKNVDLSSWKMEEVPVAFDWRDENVVTPVKNQKDCGSYAFAAIAILESQVAKAEKMLVSLSEQQIFDCDHYDNGCSGLPSQAMKYLKEVGGAEREAEYPLTDIPGSCKDPIDPYAGPGNYGFVNGSETILEAFLYHNGPLTAFINADLLQDYISGIIIPLTRSSCNPDYANMFVTIVGYGAEPKPYWIIKNSWGKKFGENGYFRLIRNRNACGIRNSNLWVSILTTDERRRK